MKKVIASLAAAAVIGTGGFMTYALIDDSKTEVKQEETQSNNQNNEAQKPISNNATENKPTYSVENPPTSRTVNVEGDVPWNRLSSDYISDLQNNGEIVYLFSDAEPLENAIAESFSTEQKLAKGATTQTLADSWATDLGSFLQVTEKYYPDKKDYFNKMKEVQSNLKSGNYEVVPALVQEAKKLR